MLTHLALALAVVLAQSPPPPVGEADRTRENAVVVSAGEKGFNLASADKRFVVKIRGLLHADGRQFLDDPALSQRDLFFVRRARPTVEATFGDWADLRLMGDFAGTPTVVDGYVDLRPFPWLKLRAGKFRPPIGLERVQSVANTLFPERSFVTAIAPNRDVGAMLHGVIGGGLLTYEVGIWNGTVDGASSDGDTNHAKDVGGRLFVQPLAGLGVGVAGITGKQYDAVGARATPSAPASLLPSFRNVGFQSVAGAPAFFSYPTGVIARGRRTRLSPQGFYYRGPFGLLGEYIQSSQRVDRAGERTTFTHRAWHISASVVLGGKPSYEGITVTRPFDVQQRTLGALELGARYHELRADDDAFSGDPAAPPWVDPARSASRASAVGGVLHWHWNRNLKLTLAYEQTRYRGGAPGGAAGSDRPTEHVLSQRLQVAF